MELLWRSNRTLYWLLLGQHEQKLVSLFDNIHSSQVLRLHRVKPNALHNQQAW